MSVARKDTGLMNVQPRAATTAILLPIAIRVEAMVATVAALVVEAIALMENNSKALPMGLGRKQHPNRVNQP